MTSYRAALRVLDIAVADEDAMIVALIQSLKAWCHALRTVPATGMGLAELREKYRQFTLQLAPVAAAGVSLNTPKLHRARHYDDVIRRFGGARHVTTDCFEMAHKALKAVLLR